MNDTSYSWSTSFVLPFESEWSINEKFCYLNALQTVGTGKNKINIPLPEENKKYNKIIQRYPFLSRGQQICPICIQHGYHSVIHNLGYFEYCFIHRNTRLVFHPIHTRARAFEKGEPLLYEFLPKVRTINLIDNQKLRMQIEAYQALVKNVFPDYLHVIDFKREDEFWRCGKLYKNTQFSLIERCFMPNNPWHKGKDRVILQITSSEITIMNRKCLWKAAKYCRKRNSNMVPSDIFSYAKNAKPIQKYACDYRLGIIFKNNYEKNIMELFNSKTEYLEWKYNIFVSKNLKLDSVKQYLQVSMLMIYESICGNDLSYDDEVISQWRTLRYSMFKNYMPVTFFDLNFLEDELIGVKSDNLKVLCFKEAIMKDALDYAIQELCNILRQKLINIDNGISNCYYPVKLPQYIIKRIGDKWEIIACDPPDGLPANFFLYEKIHLEQIDMLRTATKSFTLYHKTLKK